MQAGSARRRRNAPLARPLAGALALLLAFPASAVAASTPTPGPGIAAMLAGPEAPASEIERLYVSGQDKYGEGDFAGAADDWTILLSRLPEAQSNKATRENVLLNVLQAYLDAYNRTRGDDGKKDITHLEKGKSVLDTYYEDYNKAYGQGASVSAAVQEKGDELERELEKAREEAAAAAATPPDDGTTPPDETTPPGDTGPGDTGPSKEVIVLKPQSAGQGLIVGGSIVAALGLGAIGMLIGGGVLGNQAEEDFNAADDDAGRAEANTKGDTANALMIAGGVLAGVFLAGGGALIGLGIKKRRDADAAAATAVSMTPSVGRGFAGLSLSGRF